MCGIMWGLRYKEEQIKSSPADEEGGEEKKGTLTLYVSFDLYHPLESLFFYLWRVAGYST